MNAQTILLIVASLVGLPMLWALLIDIGKWAGIVKDGEAGKWSAFFNLLTLIVVIIVTQFFPQLDVSKVDSQIIEVVKLATIVFGYVIQLTGTKLSHKLYTNIFKIRAFSHSS